MGRLVLLLQVSRPIVWPVLPLVYGLGMQAARVSLSAAAIVQLLLLTFPMNLIGCGLNDIYDYESDRRCPRRRAVWGAVIRPEDQRFVWQACLAMMPIVILGGCIARNWDSFVTTVSLVLVAWLYSVPPVRLKERPPLDSLANGLGYFLLPFAMGYSLGADIRTIPTRYYFLALCVCGVHALATAVDYEADRAAGHRTIAVVAGRRAAAILAFAAFFVTWLFVEFQTPAVRVYIAVCTLATFAAAAIPRDRVILGACITIFAGFLIAAVFDIAGI
ncbi:MAG: UbiA family prenyltransferase [Planctomycetes bacterium]|nr:UbiA family prenyltransferase [Planctomycetota bacterium]